MTLWWLYGGYVFPVVVRPENSTAKSNFDLEGQGQLPPKTIGTLTKVLNASLQEQELRVNTIRVWTHERHLQLLPSLASYGVSVVKIQGKIDCYDNTILYMWVKSKVVAVLLPNFAISW